MTNNIGDDCQKQTALKDNFCNGLDKSLHMHMHEITDMPFSRHTLQTSFRTYSWVSEEQTTSWPCNYSSWSCVWAEVMATDQMFNSVRVSPWAANLHVWHMFKFLGLLPMTANDFRVPSHTIGTCL